MAYLFSLGVKYITTRRIMVPEGYIPVSVYNTSVSEFKRSGRPRRAQSSNRQVTMRFRLPTLFKNKKTLPDMFGSDLRSLGPIHACPCGSQLFNVIASFEDYELVWYHLDATCVNCGNLVLVPCPTDRDE